MTSKERVLKAINHEQPDRVPIDLGSTTDSSIVKECYDELRKYLGMEPTNPIFINRMMRVVDVDNDVHDYFQTDIRGVFPGKPQSVNHNDENTYKDEWGIVRTKLPGVYYFEQREFPLSGNISKRDIINYNWPDPDNSSIIKGLKEQVRKIRDNCDCAIVLNLPSCFIHTSQYLRGFQDWFLDCGMNVKILEFLFDKILNIKIRIVENLLLEVGKEVDIVIVSDDLGTQRGLQVSPIFFRKSIKSRFKKYFNVIRQFSPNLKILFHCCGSIEPILGDLIDVGIDIINPVQVSAENMDTAYLKEKYGNRLAFWGAIDTQHVLCNESPEGVRREVEHRIRELGKGGGYILGAVHNIQPGVPPENIVTMYEYGKTFSKNYYNE
jgi:uroporphyrinogen decarboxylase